MVPAQRTQLKILAALVAGGVAVGLGCGGDSGDSGDNGNGGGNMDAGNAANAFPPEKAVLQLTFNPMYSGYDGVHDYRLPVHVAGASGDLTVTTDPADFVDSEPYTDGVMLTMRQAGPATVTIQDSTGAWGSAKLTVTEFTPEQWNAGNDRYNSGGFAFDPEAGMPGPGSMRNDMAACTSCHLPDVSANDVGEGDAADGGLPRIDIEHTPQQTGGYSDEEIIAIFSEGKKPAGSPFRILPAAIGPFIYMSFHKWTMDEDSKQGLVAYLRSLEPKAQGEIDFMGLIPRNDAGMIMFPQQDAGGGTATDAGGTTTDAGPSDAGTASDTGPAADTGTTGNTDAGTTDAGA